MPRRHVIRCPECDSASVRPARAGGFRERCLRLFGYDVARCQDCGHRFLALPFGGWGESVFARCPRCLRQDLAMWDPKYYRTSLKTRLKLWFGANRWRCEPCRCNFASFRPRKQNYIRPSPGESAPA